MRIDAATRIIYHNPAIQAARVMATYAAAGLTQDLIAYYTLDEVSGNRADSHSGGYTLTDINTVTSTTGVQSNAATFAATNSEALSVTDAGNVFAPADWTISCFVRLATITGLETIAAKSSVSNPTGESFVLRLSSAPVAVEAVAYVGNSAYVAKWSAAASTATWYHVVAWHDSSGGTVNIAVNNGTPVSTSTGGGATDRENSRFTIGASAFNNGSPSFYRYLDGDVDEFGFWGRVLTADERTFLYNSGTGRTYTDL